MSDAATFLNTLPTFGQVGVAAYKPGLARMQALLADLGNPHERFRSIHLAGTNGKGSIASMLAAIGTAQGLRVGLHTSPHLLDVRERMRIDGQIVPQDWLDDAVARWQGAIAGREASYFEATVALSFCYFAEAEVDLAIVETGLGGRLDATNVLRPALSILTPIALDHVGVLGDTLTAIAREKAGIIKPATPVVVSVQPAAALAVLQSVAHAQQAPLYLANEKALATITTDALLSFTLQMQTPRHTYAALEVGLGGTYQAENAVVAVHAAELAIADLDPAAVADGLAHVRRYSGLQGRLTPLSTQPRVLLDTAHNPAAVAAVLQHVRQHTAGRVLVAFTTLRDKDGDALAQLLRQYADAVAGVPLSSPRAMPESDLAALLHAHGVPVVGLATPEEALSRLTSMAAADDTVLVLGSHHLVAAYLEHPSPDKGASSTQPDPFAVNNAEGPGPFREDGPPS